MTIDEAIKEEQTLYDIAKDKYEKLGIKNCVKRMEEHKQYIEWLEELKAIKSSDIPIIHGKEELELHDNAIRNKAIDDLMEKVSECFILDEDWDYLLQESEKLKDGGENDD